MSSLSITIVFAIILSLDHDHDHHLQYTYDNTVIIKIFGHAALSTGAARSYAQIAQVIGFVFRVHGHRDLSPATTAKETARCVFSWIDIEDAAAVANLMTIIAN